MIRGGGCAWPGAALMSLRARPGAVVDPSFRRNFDDATLRGLRLALAGPGAILRSPGRASIVHRA